MAYIEHKVVVRDCLWDLAKTYYGDHYKWTKIAKDNGIPTGGQNPGKIKVGQVIKIYDPVYNLDGTKFDGNTPDPTPSTPVAAPQPVIEFLGLISGTDREMFAAWSWSKAKDHTESYRIVWSYYTVVDSSNNKGYWMIGEDKTIAYDPDFPAERTTYTAPENATQVKVKVKALAETREVNGTDTAYWEYGWSTEKSYDFSDNPPKTPSVPDVEIKDYKLTATLNDIDDTYNATHVKFQVVKDRSTIVATSESLPINNFDYVTYTVTLDAGSKYAVRCCSLRGSLVSEWSELSDDVLTVPAGSSGITSIKATSETSVYLEWASVPNADSYDIEYATKLEYFDGSDQTTTVSSITSNHYEKTGLDSGQEYFFRVRAVNTQGTSPWSTTASIIIGKVPAAPTTWSSTTTAITGEPLTLYWIHNSADNSSQRFAQIEMYVGEMKETYTVDTTEEKDEDKTMSYDIDTSLYVEGTKIQWRVRTSGVTNEYGEWSIQRTVDIYSPATLSLSVTDVDGEPITSLTSFPLYVAATAGPNTQSPVSYHVSIIANESYETSDTIGNFKMVSAGEEVYSKHFDTSEQLTLMLSAGDVNLENNITYMVKCTVSMNSGLTAEASTSFKVAWTGDTYIPSAEIGIDYDKLTAIIRPYCTDADGNLVEGVTLSVYRREFDGSFTEIDSGLVNSHNTFIVDPHPALDFARYRVVVTTDATGAVGYTDMPGYPVGETAIVIQWAEEWSSFESTNRDQMEQAPWSGSLLKLPYNIDVATSYNRDVSTVNYVGRKHPVSYYGTHLGETATWNTVIARDDIESLYALRRLATWMGDAYVREPSGTGYWANITVAFNMKHSDPTIPITLTITRVAGGV